MKNDDISHFSTIPASFAIKSTHQYLIINNSQSQRALSVSVRTVLWIYFASRRNCGLHPAKPASQRPVWSASGQRGHLSVAGQRPVTAEKPAHL